jgi:hypothetical protein
MNDEREVRPPLVTALSLFCKGYRAHFRGEQLFKPLCPEYIDGNHGNIVLPSRAHRVLLIRGWSRPAERPTP